MVSQTEIVRQQQQQQRQLQRRRDIRLQQQVLQRGAEAIQREREAQAKAGQDKLKAEQAKQQAEYQKQQQDYEKQKVDYEAEVEKANLVNQAIREISQAGGDVYGNMDPIWKKYGRDVYNEANRYYKANIMRDVVDVRVPTPAPPTQPTTVFIGGQGFSVAPEYQQSFIEQQQQTLGIPTLPSAFKPKPQVLKPPSPIIKQDGTTPLLLGLPTRVDSRVDSGKPTVDSSSFGFFGDIFGGAKDIFKGFGTGKEKATEKEEFFVAGFAGTEGAYFTPFTPFGTGTPEITPVVKDKTTVKTQPYLEKRQIDFSGTIPITETFYVDPTGIGEQLERPATAEERKYLEQAQKSQQYSETALLGTDPLWFKKTKAKAVGGYELFTSSIKETDTDISKGLPMFPSYEEVVKTVKQSQKDFPSWMQTKDVEFKFGKPVYQVPRGYYETFKEKPFTIAATTGVFAAAMLGVGAVGGAIGTGAKAVGLGGAATVTGKVLGGGLLLGYGGLKGYQIYTSPEPFYTVGKIGAEEVTPMIAGGVIASKASGKISDWWRTRGLKELPKEDYILQDILIGKKRFVESSSYGYRGGTGLQKQKFDIKLFKQEGFYHATPEQFWTTKPSKVLAGKAEFEGLYGAPSPSIYFTKTGKYKLFGFDLFQPTTKPAIAKVKGLGYKITKVGKTGKTGKAGIYEFLGDLKPQTAYISGAKPEAEAIIPLITGTDVAKTGSLGYFDIEGRRVPLDILTAYGGTTATTTGSGVGIDVLLSSYSVGLSSPLITPSSAVVGLVSSYKPSNYLSSFSTKLSSSIPTSKVSYKPTPVSSLGVSGISGYKIPSYKPFSSLGSSASYTSPSVYPLPISSYKGAYPSSSYLTPYPKQGKPPISWSRSYRPKQPQKPKGYNVFVKSKGKFRKISKNPLTRLNALNLGSNVTDKTLSAQFSIRPTKKQAQQPRHKIPANYWAESFAKFRPHKIKKGIKQPFKNRFIEKAVYRLDTPSEVQKIGVAKYLAGLRKPIRKSKTKKKIKNIGLKLLTGF